MKKKVLVLAPHTDDGELGCGGTLAKYVAEGGYDIHIVVFSTCAESVPKGFPADILGKEFRKAMKLLGIPSSNIKILDFPVRHFPEHRQQILEELVKLNKSIKPDLVFMPCAHDIHQDHSTVATEAMRAFKRTCLLGYELPWNNYTFNNQTFSLLSLKDVNVKIRALGCYETQKMRDYFKRDYQIAIARTHGVQVGVQYAEVFEAIRWVF